MVFWKSITLQKKTFFFRFTDKLTFSNSCADQIKHGTNKLLNKNQKKMGYWYNASEVEKR